MSVAYSTMLAEDYEEIYALWKSVPGVGLNKADKRENIEAYLSHNPGQSFVCKALGRIVGTILCGSDGRRALIYHLVVSPEYQRQGIASKLVRLALEEQRKRNIYRCTLFILRENDIGRNFWKQMGFSEVERAETLAIDL